jgi:hypothetical protein
VCVPKALSAVISISLVQKSRQASIDFATPKDGLIYDKGNKDRIGKLKSFSLLFAHSFPIMRKSFPVIFHDEFC